MPDWIDYMKLMREQITALRLKKGVSEHQMSYKLGRSKGYVHNIANGKSTPSMECFLEICDYFQIDPAAFFMLCGDAYPPNLRQLILCLKDAAPEQIDLLLSTIL